MTMEVITVCNGCLLPNISCYRAPDGIWKKSSYEMTQSNQSGQLSVCQGTQYQQPSGSLKDMGEEAWPAVGQTEHPYSKAPTFQYMQYWMGPS